MDEPSLTGVRNFRDFGGFVVSGGGMARRGRLLRAAHLAEASDADLAALDAYPLSAIIDLRRPTERRLHPNRLPPGFKGVVIENDDGDLPEPLLVATLKQKGCGAEDVEAFLIDYYSGALFLPRHLDLFARAFDALETASGAVLIHCAAGKDRTGLLAALIRTALGGLFSDTLDDFVATNAATMTPESMARAHALLEKALGVAPEAPVLRAFMGVWPHHLEAAFAAGAREFGSMDGYLTHLGMDASRRARLRQRLVSSDP